MSGLQRVDDLEVGQDLEYQRNSWTVQRAGWVIMALIILAALLGLLGGDGPLAHATVGNDAIGLEVNYPRFLRRHSPTDLEVTLQPGTVPSEEVGIWIDREWLTKYDIQNIIPEPDRVEAGPDRLVYVFTLEQPNLPTSIIFNVQADHMGSASGRVSDSTEVSTWSFSRSSIRKNTVTFRFVSTANHSGG